ncbi:RING/U-box superfamily protein [Melia azedarach]|uniref:RING/U-box superfamily protein n=1 Tax=Melia azedarach TaxID=155640 RepID=A0ACC1YPB8_MELAZ|nr:RING/U-box superfamily protein [Melia azedarach]
MTSSVNKIDGEQLVKAVDNLSVSDEGQMQSKSEVLEMGFGSYGGVCAICLDKIVLQETALVKGCEHAYCVTCILRWASYIQNPTCPQCKHPFEFLNVHRSLDGSIKDFMFEESVCLLLRASWFKPLIVEDHEVVAYDEPEDYYPYEDEEDDLDEVYFHNSSSLRIGNRRWGDNGYVRAGRQEARPVHRPNSQTSGASSSREPKKNEVAKGTTGRRAKRALKREAADKAAAAKHQQHLARLGRNLDACCSQ